MLFINSCWTCVPETLELVVRRSKIIFCDASTIRYPNKKERTKKVKTETPKASLNCPEHVGYSYNLPFWFGEKLNCLERFSFLEEAMPSPRDEEPNTKSTRLCLFGAAYDLIENLYKDKARVENPLGDFFINCFLFLGFGFWVFFSKGLNGSFLCFFSSDVLLLGHFWLYLKGLWLGLRFFLANPREALKTRREVHRDVYVL